MHIHPIIPNPPVMYSGTSHAAPFGGVWMHAWLGNAETGDFSATCPCRTFSAQTRRHRLGSSIQDIRGAQSVRCC